MHFSTFEKGHGHINKLEEIAGRSNKVAAPLFGVYAATSPALSTIFVSTVHRLILTHKYAINSHIVKMLAPIQRPNCPPISAEMQIRMLIMFTIERK